MRGREGDGVYMFYFIRLVSKLYTFQVNMASRPIVIIVLSYFCLLCNYSNIFCVHGIQINAKLRGRNSISVKKSSPLAGYWKKDASSLDIFDYNAIGMDPIQDMMSLKSKKKQTEASGKNGEKSENPGRQKLIDNTNLAQRFWSGRKMTDDCPTFPFCNHIPLPRPMLLPPAYLENPNSRILYPWQNQNGNSDAFPGNSIKITKRVHGHPDRHRENVGQLNDYRKKWVRPYGRFGGSGTQMEHWSRNIYGNVMGALPITNRVSKIGTGKDLSKTAKSIAETNLDKGNKVNVPRLQNVGPGDLPAAPPSKSEYYGIHKPNTNWDGQEPKKTNIQENKEVNQEKREEVEAQKEKEDESLAKKEKQTSVPKRL